MHLVTRVLDTRHFDLNATSKIIDFRKSIGDFSNGASAFSNRGFRDFRKRRKGDETAGQVFRDWKRFVVVGLFDVAEASTQAAAIGLFEELRLVE